MDERSSEWEKNANAPMTEEVGGELSTAISSTSPATTHEPLSGGRVDAAAAVQGSGGGSPGIDATNLGDLNVGGAMGTDPASSIADQPGAGDGLDPEERAGVMGGPDPSREPAVTGGSIGGDLGGSIDSAADAAARMRSDDGETR